MWIDKITWEQISVGRIELAADEIHLWLARVDSFLKEKEKLKAFLSEEEQKKGERFHFSQDQDKFMIGRGILRVLLANYTHLLPHNLKISQSSLGKPYYSQNPPVSPFFKGGEALMQFNLSHSGNLILYGFTKIGNIGVDIEVKKEIEAEKLSQRYFSESETKMIQAAPEEERLHHFFKLWSGKEAILKMKGVGLQGELSQIEVASFSKEGTLFSFEPYSDYLGALAVEKKPTLIKFYQAEPSLIT